MFYESASEVRSLIESDARPIASIIDVNDAETRRIDQDKD